MGLLHKGLPHHGHDEHVLLNRSESCVQSVLGQRLSQSNTDRFFMNRNSDYNKV